MFLLDKVSCAGISMDPMVPQLTSTLMTIIKVGVPILLIFFGMLDLGKAVMAQKDDEIKKGQQMFMKRLVSAVIVFLVVFIVQIVIGIVASGDEDNISSCIDCLLNNECVEQ